MLLLLLLLVAATMIFEHLPRDKDSIKHFAGTILFKPHNNLLR